MLCSGCHCFWYSQTWLLSSECWFHLFTHHLFRVFTSAPKRPVKLKGKKSDPSEWQPLLLSVSDFIFSALAYEGKRQALSLPLVSSSQWLCGWCPHGCCAGLGCRNQVNRHLIVEIVLTCFALNRREC